jgi:hypothetical protein
LLLLDGATSPWKRFLTTDFEVEGTALLSSYTKDMNRVIRTYKRNRPSDDQTMYLFFMDISNLGSGREGFMLKNT